MSLIILSFLAGILSSFAPCVLPVLPIMLGSGLGANNKYRPIVIIGSAMICIVIFTVLLKATTSFINIPDSFWTMLSGSIILLYGLTLVWPELWETMSIKLGLGGIHTNSQNTGVWGDIVLGASLGPIFSSCSPTYALLLSTVFPHSIAQGIWYTLWYTAGFGFMLTLFVYGGRSMIKRFSGVTNPTGWFKKVLGGILVVTGILIISGGMKYIESQLINQGFTGASSLEEGLITIQPKQNVNNQVNTGNAKQFSGGLYTGYDENLIKQLTGNIILFFHADWCPTCQEIDKNIHEQGLPVGLTILEVDFDTAQALRKKYLVLSQSSFVLIKSDGTAIKKWIGGLKVQDIMDEVNTAQQPASQVKKIPSNVTAVAYFAGGCFWCMEAGFEGQVGVRDAIDGYIGGNGQSTSYEDVSSGKTGKREGVKVLYDPALISYEELLHVYRKLIDPTDSGGQFADRGSQYRTAIYYSGEIEHQFAEQSKKILEDSHKFDKPIVVEILPQTQFEQAEDYHQDYYKKHQDYFNSYEKGSGRVGFIDDNWKKDTTTFTGSSNNTGSDEARKLSQEQIDQNIKNLTPEQKNILYNGGTETPFDNAYWDNHAEGIYVDVIDGTPLFSSTDKFDSGTGRPSFTRPISEALVADKTDTSMPIERTEIKSTSSSGHLGHVFDDGPSDKGGKRYCINSATLKFIPRDQMQNLGYRKYLSLFK